MIGKFVLFSSTGWQFFCCSRRWSISLRLTVKSPKRRQKSIFAETENAVSSTTTEFHRLLRFTILMIFPELFYNSCQVYFKLFKSLGSFTAQSHTKCRTKLIICLMKFIQLTTLPLMFHLVITHLHLLHPRMIFRLLNLLTISVQ